MSRQRGRCSITRGGNGGIKTAILSTATHALRQGRQNGNKNRTAARVGPIGLALTLAIFLQPRSNWPGVESSSPFLFGCKKGDTWEVGQDGRPCAEAHKHATPRAPFLSAMIV
eukprot:scaffold17_cov354-Pavlova_lutheri.AAC.61